MTMLRSHAHGHGVAARPLLKSGSALTLPRSRFLPTQPTRVSLRAVSTDHGQDPKYEHFYRYTSGRWLWDEERQLQRRYVPFNVPELIRLIAPMLRNRGDKEEPSCISMTKISEGTDSKLFQLEMDNDRTALARLYYLDSNHIPEHTYMNRLAHHISSELSTTKLADLLVIPDRCCPIISETSPVGRIGARYRASPQPPGKPLAAAWHTLSSESKFNVVHGLVSIEQRLLSIGFSKYGNIHPAGRGVPGCEHFDIAHFDIPGLNELEQQRRQTRINEKKARLVVGPVTNERFWHQERVSMSIDRGPWNSPYDYLAGIAKQHIAYWRRFPNSRSSANDLFAFAFKPEEAAATHISLHEKFLEVVPYLLPEDDELVRATLWHRTLDAANIYVLDDGTITGIVNWDHAWTGPFFTEYRIPHFLTCFEKEIQGLPFDCQSFNNQYANTLEAIRAEKKRLMKVYWKMTRVINPVLVRFKNSPYGDLRRGAINRAGGTSDHSILFLQKALIQIAEEWDSLGKSVPSHLRKPCPINFTSEELAIFKQNWERKSALVELWNELNQSVYVGRDGWTANETYGEAMDGVARLKKRILENGIFRGEELRDFEERTRWVGKRKEKAV